MPKLRALCPRWRRALLLRKYFANIASSRWSSQEEDLPTWAKGSADRCEASIRNLEAANKVRRDQVVSALIHRLVGALGGS